MSEMRVDRPEAEALCRGKGGSLADIIDKVHFEKAQSLIRSATFIGGAYNHVWTGMTVDIHVGILNLDLLFCRPGNECLNKIELDYPY